MPSCRSRLQRLLDATSCPVSHRELHQVGEALVARGVAAGSNTPRELTTAATSGGGIHSRRASARSACDCIPGTSPARGRRCASDCPAVASAWPYSLRTVASASEPTSCSRPSVNASSLPRRAGLAREAIGGDRGAERARPEPAIVEPLQTPAPLCRPARSPSRQAARRRSRRAPRRPMDTAAQKPLAALVGGAQHAPHQGGIHCRARASSPEVTSSWRVSSISLERHAAGRRQFAGAAQFLEDRRAGDLSSCRVPRAPRRRPGCRASRPRRARTHQVPVERQEQVAEASRPGSAAAWCSTPPRRAPRAARRRWRPRPDGVRDVHHRDDVVAADRRPQRRAQAGIFRQEGLQQVGRELRIVHRARTGWRGPAPASRRRRPPACSPAAALADGSTGPWSVGDRRRSHLASVSNSRRGIDRLGQEVTMPAAKLRARSRVRRSRSARSRHGGVEHAGTRPAQFTRRLQAVHDRHLQVHQHQVEAVRTQQRQRASRPSIATSAT